MLKALKEVGVKMKNNEENLWKLLDNSRGTASETKTLVSLIYALHAWKNKKYPDELSFSKFYQGELTGPKLAKVFNSLADSNTLFKAYLDQEGEPSRFSTQELAAFFNFINVNSKLPEVGYAFSRAFEKFGRFSIIVPDEVAELAIRLICKDAKTVYAPFTQSLNFVYTYRDKKYFLEDQFENSLLVELIKEIDHIEINHVKADPLFEPSFTQEGASHLLKSFDVGICFPPFNSRPLRTDFYIADKFQRFHCFKGKGRLEIAFIEHLIAQVKDRVAILLPMGISFCGGIEEAFRKNLIEQNLVDTVIQLPSGLLQNTSIETILLILNKNKTSEDVFFVNAKNELFNEIRNRKKSLINLNQLIEVFETRRVIEGASNLVSRQEMEKNDFSLSPDRYIQSIEARQINKSLLQFPLVKLEDIVELRRSQAMQESEEGMEICELSPGDLPSSGYVKAAGRIKKIDTTSSRFKTYMLEPSDVLLSSKGTIGKVGIVGEQTNFIASQSFLIIRPKGAVEDAKYLYLFFKSKLGQTLLQKYSSGTAMPQIPSSALAKLEIPWPPLAKRNEMIKAFEEEIELFQKIEKLKSKVEKLREEFLNIQE